MLVSVLAIPSSPVSADGGGQKKVVVKEGESIQAAIDAAEPGTKIVVKGNHVEQVWINKSGIELIGRNATIVPPPPEERVLNPCTGGDETGPIIDRATTICVHPPIDDFPEFPEFPSDDLFLNDITVRGFDLPDAAFDAVAVFFTNHVHINRNTAVNPACDGIFVLFSSDFDVSRNTANGSQFCSGIEVAASEHGAIKRNETHDNLNNGIIANDTSYVAIERNNASGSCYGINVGNPPDFFEVPSTDVTIKRNTTNGNNLQCFPFGPDFPLGVTGILVVGASNVLIERNTANDNVSDAPSITAGGIAVFDWPGENPTDPPSAVSDNVQVGHNTAKGNSSAAGPVDLNIMTIGVGLDVHRNTCDVGVSTAGPEPTWCKH
ncbi:MAG: right-handed parallel beta-helix repeat-containing protein [Ilumatobacter sp.]